MAKKTYQEGVKEGKRQLAERLLNTLAGTLGTTTDTQLASWLGVNQSSINHWRGGISSPQKDKLSVIIKSLLSCWVQPIYEMEPIEPVQAGLVGIWIETVQSELYYVLNWKADVASISSLIAEAT